LAKSYQILKKNKKKGILEGCHPTSEGKKGENHHILILGF
jgi:hypothetical protein